MTLHWSARFVGLPWAEKGRDRSGVDCYGVISLVYSEALGIALPSYTGAYASVAERGEIAGLMSEDSSRWPWLMVPPGCEREYDVALFRRVGLAAHVGVAIGGGRMLHIEAGRLSGVSSYASPPWAQRLIGIYRHADMR